MAPMTTPDLQSLIQPLLGTPYQERYCWDFVRQLFQQAFGLRLDADPGAANVHLMEVWFLGDPREPLALVQPWDCVVYCEQRRLPISSHVGLVVDQQTFVHAREQTGVVVERLRLWRPKLLQIARLRRLL